MFRFRLIAAALVGAASLSIGLPAAASPLTVLGDILSTYGVFTFGDMGSSANPYSSDSEGPVAVGGNAFVGGNADFHDGSEGGATIFGTLTVNGTLINPPTQYVGAPLTGPNPVDFNTVRTEILAASSMLAASTGGTLGAVVYNNEYNQKELTLNGTSTVLNVFHLSGALLSQISGVNPDFSDGGGSLHMNIATGGTAVINVDGITVNIGHPGNFGFFCNGRITCPKSAGGNVLFNFFVGQFPAGETIAKPPENAEIAEQNIQIGRQIFVLLLAPHFLLLGHLDHVG